MSLRPTGASFSHYFSYHHSIAFHHISLVMFFIPSSLFYLLLVLFHIFFTLSGALPQFIAWRIVTSFPLSITWTLIQRSLVWEGHLIWENFGSVSIHCWYHIWGSFVYVQGVRICIYVKKMMNEKKRKISTCVYVHSILHHWVCILILEGRVIEYVCWWELVCELSKILFFLCIHFATSLWEWDEWSSPKDSGSLSFPLLHSLLMWLHFMFDLSWSPIFFVYSLFCYHPCHCLWFIPFVSPPCFFLTLTYFRFDISLASSLRISLSVWFSSLPHYYYYTHIGHS